MVTHIVESVCLADVEDTCPTLLVHWRISCKRVDTFIDSSAKHDRIAVYNHLLVLYADVAVCVNGSICVSIFLVFKQDVDLLDITVKLIPLRTFDSERKFKFRSSLGYLIFMSENACSLSFSCIVCGPYYNMVRIYSCIIYSERRDRADLYITDDTVPVGLGVSGYAMRPCSDRNLVCVVDTYSHSMLTGSKRTEIMYMRHRECVLTAYESAVNPDVGLPVTALKEKFHMFAVP